MPMTPTQLDDFFSGVLRKLFMASTPGRLEFFRRWAAGENTGATWNPLATTQPTRQFPDDGLDLKFDTGFGPGRWNNANAEGDERFRGVKVFAHVAAGMAATAETLANGYYDTIVQSIADEHVYPEAIPEIRKWGTTAFAALLAEGWRPAAWTALPAEHAAPPAPPVPGTPQEPPQRPKPFPLTQDEIWNYVSVVDTRVEVLANAMAELNRAVLARDDRLRDAFAAIAEGAVLASAKADEAADTERVPD